MWLDEEDDDVDGRFEFVSEEDRRAFEAVYDIALTSRGVMRVSSSRLNSAVKKLIG